MDNTIRIPRPKGYTELRHISHISNNDIDIRNTIQHLLRHYINTGFTYCGIQLDVEQLAHLTGIDNDMIMDAILESGKVTYEQLGDEASGDILRVLIGLSLKGTLSDHQRALRQYSILAAAQGDKYVPFVSGEVNRALKLTLESTAAITNLYKTITGSGGLTVNVNQQNNMAHQENNYLTTQKALELMESNAELKAPLLQDPEALKGLAEHHGLEDMPEVRARKQTSYDTGKEGLNLKKIATVFDGLVNDVDKKERLKAQELSHIDRRAQELNIDLEADEL